MAQVVSTGSRPTAGLEIELWFASNWWAIALRGALAIAFGIVAFFWPGLVWLAVVYLIGAYALIDGVMAIVAAIRGRGTAQPWWAFVFEGLLGIAVGIVAFVLPGLTEVAMLYMIAAWSMAAGVLTIMAAARLRHYIEGEWLLALAGALSIILGLGLGLWPIAGLIVVAWWIGAYEIAFGIVLLVLGFKLRSLAHSRHRPRSAVSR
jgi:uncharacterized membrane protein HdeD (DUF308 family)